MAGRGPARQLAPVVARIPWALPGRARSAAATMIAGPALWPALGNHLFGAGVLLLAGSITAQWLGFLRKNDTPSRDIHHILLGYCAGLLACGAWLWQTG